MIFSKLEFWQRLCAPKTLKNIVAVGVTVGSWATQGGALSELSMMSKTVLGVAAWTHRSTMRS